MILYKGIQNLFRARGKTVLFFVLIFILTLLAGLDGFVWYSVSQYLNACEQNFTTIGLVEYMGPEYPNERVYDAGAQTAAAAVAGLGLAENENVLHLDPAAQALGFTEGFTRRDREVYDKNRAVLVVRASVPQDAELFWGQVVETLYSYEDRTNHVLFLHANGYTELETGHYYLASGSFFSGPSSYAYFGFGALRSANGAEESPVFMDITDPNAKTGYTLPAHSEFYDIAETTRILNNSLDVYATGDIEAQLPFHQDTVRLAAGRLFTAEEYASGARVCLVPETMAQQLSCGVGDTLPISLMRTAGMSVYDSFRSEAGFDSAGDYTVVGLLTVPDTMRHCVYVPAGGDPIFAENDTVGYTLCTLRLKNGGADAFYRDMQGKLPERVRLTVYDQGFAAVEKPFREVLRITNIVSVVCAFVGLCILLLFGFLFVYRQRDVSVTMIRLGAGKRRVCGYFLSGAALLSLVSVCAGALLGYRLSGRMGAVVARAAASVTTVDLRYSNAALSIVKSLPFTPAASAAPFLLMALAIFLLAVLCCFCFTAGTFRQKRVRAPRTAVPERASGRVSRGGRGGYALLSICRGGARSVIPPLTALVAVLFLCQLSSSMTAYRTEYDALFENTVVRGYATDSHGKLTGKLAIPATVPNVLQKSGCIKDMTLTRAFPYLYEDIAVSGGVPQEVTPVQFPTTDYSMETFWNKILAGPSLIYTNDLTKAPEFYYSSHIETEFLEGYDLSVFAAPRVYDEPEPVLLSSSFMKENGIKLGDTVTAWIFWDYLWSNFHFEMRVVGSYVKAGLKDNVYAPLSGFIDGDMLKAEEGTEDYEILTYNAFHSMEFTLSDAAQLGEFKDYLEREDFSGIGRMRARRVFLLLEDKTLSDTAETLTRQIRYVGALYPVLYALTGAAGLIAAYLLLVNRRREYAVMRALGTPKRRVFGIFFSEQLLLCIPGDALGLAAAYFMRMSLAREGVWLAAGFALCWLVGSAAALIRMNGPTALAALHEEE